ncbi:MAG: flavin reductase family protein [Actinomycetota bacterium]|nr:flavin reductase family protein [Actinomycetota bacterium]
MTVVTAIDEDGHPQGMVIGSFTSVSLDPPLVAFLPTSTSGRWSRLRRSGSFCVNILGAQHERLCRQFASRDGDTYDGVEWTAAPSGSPILEGAVAWIDCDLEIVHVAGDHDIVIGRVLDLDTADQGLPLLFFQGGYGSFTPHTMIASDDPHTAELSLVDRARPLLEGAARSVQGRVAVLYCDGTTSTVIAAAGHSNDRHVAQAAIGEPVPLTAPIGIWWMAHAAPERVQEWLAPLPQQQQQKVTEVMGRIRADGGLCVGLAAVQDGLEHLLEDRAGGNRRSASQEAQMLSDLTRDPMDFVASRFADGETTTDHPEVCSIWSPVLDQAGNVVLGVVATDFPADQSLTDVEHAVRHVAAGISALTRTRTAQR